MTATSSPRVRDILTPYRVACTLALVGALLLLVLAFQRAPTRARPCNNGPIVSLLPCPDATGLSQGVIGANLQAGYLAALQIDGLEIPQDQLRTGGPNRIYFQPGPATETGALAPGLHHATVIYWQTNSDRDHGVSFPWSFTVQ